MLPILCVRLMIKVKMGIPESFKVGWYPPPKKKTGSSHLNTSYLHHLRGAFSLKPNSLSYKRRGTLSLEPYLLKFHCKFN